MKNSTAKKILKRYIRGLSFMEAEARSQGEPMAIVEHYVVDRIVLETALKALEEKEE